MKDSLTEAEEDHPSLAYHRTIWSFLEKSGPSVMQLGNLSTTDFSRQELLRDPLQTGLGRNGAAIQFLQTFAPPSELDRR
jgi:hypothetical protein